MCGRATYKLTREGSVALDRPTPDQPPADVFATARAILSESKLLHAMFNVGYLPANTPPDECFSIMAEDDRKA
jgi:hypothetical protein